jgi:acetylornithine/succinyldiaminopimelate/putrescine aminotransferase
MLPLKEYFFKHIAQTSDSPIAICVKKAKGEYIYDENGKAYLDCISGISVSNIGHQRSEVIEAIKLQAEQYLHTMVYGEHIQNPQVLLAKKLTEQTNFKLDNVYFVNSGAEAIDGAIKLARRYTGKKQIISCKNSYHGSTIGAMSLMNNKQYFDSYGPFLQDVDYIEFNNEDSLEKITDRTAAVFIELVQSEAGYIPIKESFLKAVKNKCLSNNSLLVFDEIQTGIGRTGKFFAFEHYNVYPDILLLAKALGGGLPLGAIISTKNIMSVFTHNPSLGHLTTFGGNPLSCAASLASIQYIEKNNLLEKVAIKEKYFLEKLPYNNFVEIRSKGLMIGLQLSSHQEALNIVKHCFNKGILVDWFLFNESAIRIAPPLTISFEQIDYICDVLKKSSS